ncbi:MAG: hypothetical protein M3Y56_06615, partial [Armatimonadota bacterium]|nr:hypothetical protein [Armatimonadota bacterium]
MPSQSLALTSGVVLAAAASYLDSRHGSNTGCGSNPELAIALLGQPSNSLDDLREPPALTAAPPHLIPEEAKTTM